MNRLIQFTENMHQIRIRWECKSTIISAGIAISIILLLTVIHSTPFGIL